MGIVRMGVPEELVLFLQRSFGLDVFIETGTFKGATSSWAAGHFKEVITIELSKELSDAAAQRFLHLKNVQFRCGDSAREVTRLLKDLGEPALFWLDAHHCSQGSAGEGSKAPILEEIDAICSSPFDHFILIDDARLFLAPPPDPHALDEYPDLSLLIEQLNRRKKHYVVTYDDVIICVPECAREQVRAFCKQQTTHNDRVFWAQKSAASQKAGSTPLGEQVRNLLGNLSYFFSRKSDQRRRWNRFEEDFAAFAALNKKRDRFPCTPEERYPCLDDVTATVPVDRHYVLHPAWAMRILFENRPALHVDISSTLRFVTQLSSIMPVRHYDYRPPLLDIRDLACGQADLTDLPFATDSIPSLSCMHTVEHVGLGRYGDRLDSEGDLKAAGELARVLSPGGNLLFVVPVGRSRIAFNAHRIYAYRQVLELFPSLLLKQYALIPDSHEEGDLVYGASEALTDSQSHGCGCFWFTKRESK